MNSGLIERTNSSTGEWLSKRDWKSEPRPILAATKDGAQRELIYQLGDTGQIVITIQQPLHQVTHHRILQIIDFCKLQNNWDSYGARAIDPLIAITSLTFLLTVIPSTTPPPSIVPTPEGGIQFEWHRNGVDLEINVCANQSFEVWFEDLNSGDVLEETIRDNFQPLMPLFERLSRPQ